MIDVLAIRQDFPILKRRINGKRLVYLDNAATAQKPYQVIEAMVDYYKNHNANIHRGIHTLAEEATSMYEGARGKIAKFIGANSPSEVIFVRNSTEAINLVAYSWGLANLRKGEEIILTETEHHSNLVPWQIIARKTGAVLKFIRTDDEGYLDLSNFQNLLTRRSKIVAAVQISNVLGVINPVEKIAKLAKKIGAKILIDGSQSLPRMPIDVNRLGWDFFAATGHKMMGPTGIGILWGRREILEEMPPFLGGGDMIREVYSDRFIANDLPYKFEAGTPNIAGAIGLGAAVDYLEGIGMENVFEHEKKLTAYALGKLRKIKNLTIYGPKNTKEKIGVVAFNLKGIHAHDLAQLLNEEGIAIRSGHHCAMPLHREKLHVSASARASFYIYNDKDDVDQLVKGIEKAKKVFYG